MDLTTLTGQQGNFQENFYKDEGAAQFCPY